MDVMTCDIGPIMMLDLWNPWVRIVRYRYESIFHIDSTEILIHVHVHRPLSARALHELSHVHTLDTRIEMNDERPRILMNNVRNIDSKKRVIPKSTFACPAGCGELVGVNDVNNHLDRCLGLSNDDGGANAVVFGGVADLSDHGERQKDSLHQSEYTIKSVGAGMKRAPSHSALADGMDVPNAFLHIMKRSATVFSKSRNKENLIRHRFHLHNVDGMVTWTSDDSAENNNNCIHSVEKRGKNTEIQWSTVLKMKKMKDYELTVSTSLPSSPGSKTEMLVRKHSRLSVSGKPTHVKLAFLVYNSRCQFAIRIANNSWYVQVSQLKSCLQKSIRRRAPLPAVRVAMELADKSWSDFVRRYDCAFVHLRRL